MLGMNLLYLLSHSCCFKKVRQIGICVSPQLLTGPANLSRHKATREGLDRPLSEEGRRETLKFPNPFCCLKYNTLSLLLMSGSQTTAQAYHSYMCSFHI